jgi:hypothetical protein
MEMRSVVKLDFHVSFVRASNIKAVHECATDAAY